MNSALMPRREPEYLKDLADNSFEEFCQSKPFPHIVIDIFLPEGVLDNILNEFPKAGAIDWQKFDKTAEKKLANKHEQYMRDNTRLLLS
jgi:hypothetical protein